MKTEKIKKLVSAALFTAVICVSTYIVQIPMPATGGYVNLGDCFVLTSGILLGPCYGALAAGLGSALADMLAGYMQYVPATFVIKSLMGVTAYFLFFALKKAFSGKYNIISKCISVFVSETLMVAGYFAYEAVVLGYGIAASGSILGNITQGCFGAIAAIAFTSALEKASSKSKTLSSFFKAG